MEPLRFTREAMREVDRRAVADFGIPSIVLMENAASGCAAIALRVMRDRGLGRALVVAGPGNNGGDGFAIARRLEGFGVPVSVSRPLGPAASDDARTNESICERMGLSLEAPITTDPSVLVIDALLGTGLSRPAEGEAAEAIGAMNRSGMRLAVDLPSGVSAASGEPLGPVVRADVTAAFVGLKPGMPAPGEPGREPFGAAEIVDIGVPNSLKRELAGQ